MTDRTLYVAGCLLHGANLAALTPAKIVELVGLAKSIVKEIERQTNVLQ